MYSLNLVLQTFHSIHHMNFLNVFPYKDNQRQFTFINYSSSSIFQPPSTQHSALFKLIWEVILLFKLPLICDLWLVTCDFEWVPTLKAFPFDLEIKKIVDPSYCGPFSDCYLSIDVLVPEKTWLNAKFCSVFFLFIKWYPYFCYK